jgi:serine/threonine protein phosphatase 1
MLYAVGDIHGELGKLERLLASLPLEDGDRLVFLGDYVDRGPDSAGVVERLIALEQERDCVFLLGNHESMFLDFLGVEGGAYFGGETFLLNGGERTLASYGLLGADDPHARRLPPAHERFLRACRLHHLEGEYLFVHAGLGRRALERCDPREALRHSRPEELLWSRSTADRPHALGVTVVFGHTPRADFSVYRNGAFSIGIDTGATYGGPLTALRLPDERVFQSW